MDALTRRQMDVLNYISEFQSGRGTAPTLREIGSAFGVCVASVQKYLRALSKKGFVSIDPRARRGIRLTSTRKDWKVRQGWQGDFDKRLGAKLRAATDLTEMFGIVREDLRAWLDVDRADLYVLDPQTRELRESSSFGVDPAAARSGAPVPPVPSESIVGLAFRRRKPVLADAQNRTELLEAERARRRERAGPGPETTSPGGGARPPRVTDDPGRLLACAAVPVLGRDRVVGVLRLDERRPEGIDEGKLTRAAMAASALAPALEQGTLHAELQRRIRLQAALVELCRTINTVTGFQKALRDVYGIVNTLVDAPAFLIAVRDDAGQWWMLLETDNVDGNRVESSRPRPITIGHTEALEAIRNSPYWIRHRSPEEVRTLEEKGPAAKDKGLNPTGHVQKRSRSILYVPLRSGGEMTGYLSAQSYTFNAYTLQDAEDLILVSEYIGLAAQSALREELGRARQAADKKLLDRFDRLPEELRSLATDPAASKSRLETIAAELEALRTERTQDPAKLLTR